MPFALKPQGSEEEKPVPSRARCSEIGVRPQWGSLKTISESDRMRLVKKKAKEVDDCKVLNEHCWESISDKKVNESNERRFQSL